MSLAIALPSPDDAPEIGAVHLAAWLRTYPNAAAGITEEWLTEQRGDLVEPAGIAGWRAFLVDALDRPDLHFCRVVRAESEIAGFLCGRRAPQEGAGAEASGVSLGPMYLLEAAQGQGVGRRLMSEFLGWAGSRPVHLWVTSYNERAIRFYADHGFRPTGERTLWRGRLPNVRMLRDPGPVVGRAPGERVNAVSETRRS
ncbi:hypothetical protein GCM10009665_40680 [Kitasatospora nipponensis]|uniref:N-acetyltransferase domain-containing protein n=1 Tax=Kitasatospora nipponensis TaxID=258049 RepID=A0ABN1WD89_9ACTN